MASIYQNCKSLLISEAKQIKSQSNDKPYIRKFINDTADSICRQLNHHELQGRITKKQNRQYQNWIHNLAGDLHPTK